MKRASETNEVEILDEAHRKHGADSEWGAFSSQRLNPLEMLMGAEDESEEPGEPGERGAVLMVLLDLVFQNWNAEVSVEKVGRRARAVGAAVSHRGGRGLPMLGARLRLEAAGSREDVRRILDWFYLGDLEDVALGKRLVTIGKFLGHAAFDDWSMSALGRACGETPQAMQERTEVLCEEPLRISGSKGKAVWQQPEWQRAKSREAQNEHYRTKKAARKKRAAKKEARKNSDNRDEK